ncbi:MAG: hypothetical protein F6K22_02570 [Okeania sp. SIO2F4]|uniref:hypothetical protein n=1 Tax=Okeania sp. SIO2F4 TaxID=2607790 RepID=UPI00142A1689|nr:hypothetical protein [Okeania sp. SIO2F4]NES01807.1 hypothetical protein [Okeania sp. SIO2F4]
MLFIGLEEAINSTTNSTRDSLEARIEELERQLVQLRNEHAANEERHQNQKTLKGALESGLVQIIKAVNATKIAGEEELELGFWQEVEKIRSGDYDSIDLKELPEADDLSDTPYRPDDSNGGDDSGLIDVITVEVDSDNNGSSSSNKSNGNGSKKGGNSQGSIPTNGKNLSDEYSIVKSNGDGNNYQSKPKSVGAYYLPIEERNIQQLKDLCNGFGFTKEQLREYGSLKQRDTYLKALQSVKNLLGGQLE